jgi:hypothetical protein
MDTWLSRPRPSLHLEAYLRMAVASKSPLRSGVALSKTSREATQGVIRMAYQPTFQ